MPSYQATLSVVDQANPFMSTPMWLVFASNDPDAAVAALQKGIDRTVSQLPFLAGTLHQDPEDGYQVKLSWSDEDPKVHMEEVAGQGLPDYTELAAFGWCLHKLDFDFRPPSLLRSMTATSQPGLIVSYTKIKGGLIVLLAPHHSMMDGGGRALLFNVLADNTRGDTPAINIQSKDPLTRIERLHQMLDVVSKSSDSGSTEAELPYPGKDSLGALAGSAPMSMKLFSFSVRRLEALRQALSKHTSSHFSLNSMMMTIFWLSISAARFKRLQRTNPHFKPDEHSSELIVAVNTRKYFEQAGAMAKNTWLGNLAKCASPLPRLYMDSITPNTFDIELPASVNSSGSNDAVESLTISVSESVPTVIKTITDSLALTSVQNATGSFKNLADTIASTEVPDHRPFRDLSNVLRGLNVMVTNWGALDLLADYGPFLGRPACARQAALIPIEGAIIMLPRHRTADVGTEALDRFEAMVTVREDDMEEIVQDSILNTILSKPPV